MPDTRGASCVTTGPWSVKNKLWHPGRDQILRLAPARRRHSARKGNPPTFGRIAAACSIAFVKLSIALLMRFLHLDWWPRALAMCLKIGPLGYFSYLVSGEAVCTQQVNGSPKSTATGKP